MTRSTTERRHAPASEPERRRLIDELTDRWDTFDGSPDDLGCLLAEWDANGLATVEEIEGLLEDISQSAGPDLMQALVGATERSSRDRASRDREARQAATRRLIARLAPELGLRSEQVDVRVDAAAKQRTEEAGASGLMVGGLILLHPAHYEPSAESGRALLAHEMVHLAQHVLAGTGRVGSSVAAEREARTMAAAFGRGASLTPPSVRLAPGAIAANDEDTEPDAELPPTLTNARFAADRQLTRILEGRTAALSSAHNGRGGAVSKVQRALVDLGFDLPMHEVDGSYGGETEEAIRQFRVHHLGESEETALTVMDAAALEVLDRVAPAEGERVEHTVEYDRLLADGRLDITVGIGYDESPVWRQNAEGQWEETGRQTHEDAATSFRTWLGGEGFELELLGLDSVEYWGRQRDISYTNAEGATETRSIRVWLALITPGEGAAGAFQRELADAELGIYTGHARYGSGPDFDDKASPVENFRIGIDAAMAAAGRRTRVDEARHHGVAVDEQNDLQEMVERGDFDPEQYRLWFFQACTSMAYLDEVRALAGGTETVDVVGSRAPTTYDAREGQVGVPEAQRMIQGILSGESIEDIVDALNERQRQMYEMGGTPTPRGGVFSTSGIGDNPTSP